jgi:formate dehydrogenase major subunit
MTRRAGVLDGLEPEAVAHLHPREVDRLGLHPGDPIRVVTRRGAIELHLRADRDVPAGMVFIAFCFGDAPANVLTNPHLDPFGKIPEFKFCAARVERLPAPVPV